MDLREFFIEHPYQFVVLLDGFKRFDKYSLSARTGAVHHALYTPFLFHLDRNYKALAADGNQIILHRAAFGKFSEVAAERVLDKALLLFHVATDSCQFRRGAVVQCAIRQNLVAEGAEEISKVHNRGGKRSHRIPFPFHGRRRMQSDLAPLRSSIHDQHDVANLSCLQGRAFYAGLFNKSRNLQQS